MAATADIRPLCNIGDVTGYGGAPCGLPAVKAIAVAIGASLKCGGSISGLEVSIILGSKYTAVHTIAVSDGVAGLNLMIIADDPNAHLLDLLHWHPHFIFRVILYLERQSLCGLRGEYLVHNARISAELIAIYRRNQGNGTVRRYTDATTITKRMVAELIDHIEVYHAEKQDGVTNQRVVIHYNCIGAFDVPDRRKIPEADIIMETRKGVALSYAPEQVAV